MICVSPRGRGNPITPRPDPSTCVMPPHYLRHYPFRPGVSSTVSLNLSLVRLGDVHPRDLDLSAVVGVTEEEGGGGRGGVGEGG